MRKKSHISLARYIVQSMEEAELTKHRKSFYLGSILPDCRPSFLTTRHEFYGTFEQMRQSIRCLTTDYDIAKLNYRVFCRDLGEIIHYIADYFTFPHNITYDGSLKDHCIYEKNLKFALREYIKSGEAEKNKTRIKKFDSPEALCDYISEMHKEYIKIKRSIQDDCNYIVSLCHVVVQSIIQLFQCNHKLVLQTEYSY